MARRIRCRVGHSENMFAQAPPNGQEKLITGKTPEIEKISAS